VSAEVIPICLVKLAFYNLLNSLLLSNDSDLSVWEYLQMSPCGNVYQNVLVKFQTKQFLNFT